MVIFLLPMACDSKDQTKKDLLNQQRHLVVPSNLDIPLHFIGKVEPIKIDNVVSPVDGVIESQHFSYGQSVQKDEVIYTIIADKLEQEYIEQVSSYMKAMNDYSEKKRRFSGAENLLKLKFISENDYHAEKIALDESYFHLKHAYRKLVEILDKAGVSIDLNKIDFQDQKIIDELVSRKISHYVIKSPVSGVVLNPELLIGKDSGDSKVAPGKEVSKGEVLMYIGDHEGLSVVVKVHEIDIRKIYPGQRAIITGVAFPEYKLSGVVDSVDNQAEKDNSAIPLFRVHVVVPTLTKEEKNRIKFGMSAQVDIATHDEKVLLIPIDAVKKDNGQGKVLLEKKDSKTLESVSVDVGKTTMNAVVINKGVQSGDTIVYSRN